MTRNPLPRIALALAAVAVAAAAQPAWAEEHGGTARTSGDSDVRWHSIVLGTSSARLAARLAAPTPPIRGISFDRSPTQGRDRPRRVRPRDRQRRGGLSRSAKRMLLHAALGAGVGTAIGSFAGWAVCNNSACPLMSRYGAVGGLVGLGMGVLNGR